MPFNIKRHGKLVELAAKILHWERKGKQSKAYKAIFALSVTDRNELFFILAR